MYYVHPTVVKEGKGGNGERKEEENPKKEI